MLEVFWGLVVSDSDKDLVRCTYGFSMLSGCLGRSTHQGCSSVGSRKSLIILGGSLFGFWGSGFRAFIFLLVSSHFDVDFGGGK